MPDSLPPPGAAKEQWDWIERAFHEALELSEDQREAFIQQRCQSRQDLLRELRSLLDAWAAQQPTAGSRPPAADPEIGTHYGPYRIERLIGKGGMGAVYLARRIDGQFEQSVALKRIAPHLVSPVLAERFRIERQALAELEHPYIARLIDGGISASGALYLVMEYVEGQRVDRYCEERALPLRARLELFLKICSAVDYAHRHLIVHRDIKPDNILVQADGTPKLVDFGMAKFLTEWDPAGGATTRMGLRAFTPRYASPEQILGRPVSTATDVYSLGVLLYLLLTGALPYQLREHSSAELIDVVCRRPPARPSSHARWGRQLEGDLDAIVLKALRKEPEDRYRSVEQFAADIRRHLDGLPVVAVQGDFRYRAAKFIRRNRLAVALASSLAATAIAGAGVVLWQYAKAEEERRRAETRVADVRGFANSLLFEINDVISQLPGSTPVQNLLVSRALKHMDQLMQDASGDPSLQLDLIEAYIKLGDIQGNPRSPNLGDAQGALATLRKAEAMAQSMLAGRRQQPRLRLALGKARRSIGDLLLAIGNAKQAVAVTREACDLLHGLTVSQANAEHLLEAARCWSGLGDQLGNRAIAGQGDVAEARKALERSLELFRRLARLREGKVEGLRGIGGALLALGRLDMPVNPGQAAAWLQQAIAAFESLPDGEFRKPGVRRLWANAFRQAGIALRAMGRYEEALAQFSRSLEGIRSLAAADPQDGRAQFDLALALDEYAQAQSDRKAYVEAAAAYRESLQLITQALQRARENALLEGYQAELKWRLAGVIRLLGKRTEAEHLLAQALPVIRRQAEAPAAPAPALERAAQAFRSVEPARFRDPAFALSCARRLLATDPQNPDYQRYLAEAERAVGAVKGQ